MGIPHGKEIPLELKEFVRDNDKTKAGWCTNVDLDVDIVQLSTIDNSNDSIDEDFEFQWDLFCEKVHQDWANLDW